MHATEDRFTKQVERNRAIERALVGTAGVGVVLATGLSITKVIGVPSAVIVLPLAAGAASVILLAKVTGFLDLLNLKDAAFALVAVPDLDHPCDWHERRFLLAKQLGHPHRGQWIMPGGLFDPKRDRTLLDTAKRKTREMTGIESLTFAQTPFREYKRRMPDEGLAYRGAIYEAFAASVPVEEGDHEKKWMTGDAVLEAENIPYLVREVFRDLREIYGPGQR
jgi:ADP-ribose pyrophosphatase YjhB (NUDIX family)